MDRPNPSLASVIIPAHNAERFLRSTLTSARAQTYENLEIIVVDDGSEDSTFDVATHVAQADKRVRVIRQRHSGVAAARNRAIAESQGDFIAPLDADDVWHPQNLALQIEALTAAGSDSAVSYAWSVMIDEHSQFRGIRSHYNLQQRRKVLARQIEGNFIGNASSSVMKRHAVLAVGGYDESLRARDAQGCEDQALYIALAERWNFTVVTKYLIAYRVHPNSMAQDGARMARSCALLLSDLRQRRPDLPAYWFGRGRAQFYENTLTLALRYRRWKDVAEIVTRAAHDGRWCLFDLLGRRLGPRMIKFSLKYSLRKIRPDSPSAASNGIDPFWMRVIDD